MRGAASGTVATRVMDNLQDTVGGHPPPTGPPPVCWCKPPAPARAWQTKKEGANRGKWFFKCDKPQGSQCRFFQWAATGGAGSPSPSRQASNQPALPASPAAPPQHSGYAQQQQQQQQQQQLTPYQQAQAQQQYGGGGGSQGYGGGGGGYAGAPPYGGSGGPGAFGGPAYGGPPPAATGGDYAGLGGGGGGVRAGAGSAGYALSPAKGGSFFGGQSPEFGSPQAHGPGGGVGTAASPIDLSSPVQRQAMLQQTLSQQQQQQQQPGGGGGAAQPQQQQYYGSPGGGSGSGQYRGALWPAPNPQIGRSNPNTTVSVSFISAEQVGLSFAYNPSIVELIKSMPIAATHRAWDGASKTWRIDAAARGEAVAYLRACGLTVNDEIPQAVVSTISATGGIGGRALTPHSLSHMTDADAQGIVSAALPRDVWERLFPFQQEGVRFGVKAGGRVLLADEMGLGKTCQAICIASCFPADWPLLVVCPSSMRFVWAAELRSWLPGGLQPAPDDLWVISSGADLSKRMAAAGGVVPTDRPHVCITSYDLVQRLDPQAAAAYGAVICDESHALKSRETQRTQFVARLVRRAKRSVLITGTPLLSRPVEIYPQVDMLRQGLLGTFLAFGERYCLSDAAANARAGGGGGGGGSPYGGGAIYPGMEFRGARNLLELRELLSTTVMVRRTKAEVGTQLPDKIRKAVPIPIDPDHVETLAGIQGEMRAAEARERSGQLSPDQAASERKELLMRYYRATGPAKVKETCNYLLGLLHREGAPGAAGGGGRGGGRSGRGAGAAEDEFDGSDGKVLVFGHHKSVLLGIAQALCRDHNIDYIHIDGDTAPHARPQLVSRFQSDPACRVALLSINAAGVGLTLTAARDVVFAELFWNPGAMVQGEDRAHRLGQTEHVTIHYLLAQGTCDDVMWPLANAKLRVVGRTLDGAGGAGDLRSPTRGGAGTSDRAAAAAGPSGGGAGAAGRGIDLAAWSEAGAHVGESEGGAAGGDVAAAQAQPGSVKRAAPRRDYYDLNDGGEEDAGGAAKRQRTSSQQLASLSQQQRVSPPQPLAKPEDNNVVDLTQSPPREEDGAGSGGRQQRSAAGAGRAHSRATTRLTSRTHVSATRDDGSGGEGDDDDEGVIEL